MNFREWPLVLFTLLFSAAAGAATIFWAADLENGPGALGTALAALLLSAGAALLSLFHLGRPGRAPRSSGNIRRSWLSREIVLLLAFNAAAAALVANDLLVLRIGGILGPIASLIGLAGVFAMSKIYMLPAVPDWDSWRTPSAFFSSAFVLGSPIAALASGGLKATVPALLIAAYFLNLLFAPRFGVHRRRPTPLGFRPNPVWPLIFAIRLIVLAAAIFLWMASFETAALASTAASEIIGRLQFYDLPLGLSRRE